MLQYWSRCNEDNSPACLQCSSYVFCGVVYAITCESKVRMQSLPFEQKQTCTKSRFMEPYGCTGADCLIFLVA